MNLLELDCVSKRHTASGRVISVLENASLRIDPGEVVAVCGQRQSGRTSLLRIAAGIDRPDSGSVLFAGRDLTRHCDDILGHELVYCRLPSRATEGRDVLDDLCLTLLLSGVAPRQARLRAHQALARVGVGDLATRRVTELDPAQRARVAIAHAAALSARMLLIDEPVTGVDIHQRDDIVLLLRSLADDGVAVLMTVGKSSDLWGADQPMMIGEGLLTGGHKRELQPVADLTLHRRTRG